ncbi:hypothetical protein AVEN_82593-1 [Araneus ventricosus]|uniref:Uncharacterized protein n=1 Tax=Araneus ventricosus TaxID=182803 RepID=A0A4Y2CPE3_ARAVE|nr:hypothetical protein AVEN_82593-1 [Araneus ventricosus]
MCSYYYTTMLGLPVLAIPRALFPIPDEKPRAVSSFSIPAPSSQVFRHQKIMFVLTIGGKGFTVTTGRVSYSSVQHSRKLLRKVLANIGAQSLFHRRLDKELLQTDTPSLF